MNRPVLLSENGHGHDRLPSEHTSEQKNYSMSRQSASGYDKPFEAFRGLAWDPRQVDEKRREWIRKTYPPIVVE